jgi:hypothetical protein
MISTQQCVNLHKLIKITVLNNCAYKTKIALFRRNFHIRTKIVIEKEPFEQVSHFYYVVAPPATLIKML